MFRKIAKGVHIGATVLFLGLPLACFAGESAVSEMGIDGQVIEQRSADQEWADKARLFAAGIVLVSFGAIGSAAVLHVYHAERKRIGSRINDLGRFIATASAISTCSHLGEDVEPLVEEIKQEEISKEKELKAIHDQETALVERYSAAEAKLIHLLGRDL